MTRNSEVRGFLMGWLMEFGPAPVPLIVLYDSRWYLHHHMSRGEPDVSCFLHETDGEDSRYWCINQAGLDFLKGDPND